MGLAGSGKGTQGEILAKKLGYDYFSTGNYLRSYLTAARKAEMLKGKLIGDAEMIEIVQSYFSKLKNKSQTILDGFPRTLAQAKWLMEQQDQEGIEGLIFLNVPQEELTDRLLKRARPDDTKSAIKKRFNDYIDQTAPVIKLFEEAGVKIHRIKGDQSVDKVQADIVTSLKNSSRV